MTLLLPNLPSKAQLFLLLLSSSRHTRFAVSLGYNVLSSDACLLTLAALCTVVLPFGAPFFVLL